MKHLSVALFATFPNQEDGRLFEILKTHTHRLRGVWWPQSWSIRRKKNHKRVRKKIIQGNDFLLWFAHTFLRRRVRDVPGFLRWMNSWRIWAIFFAGFELWQRTLTVPDEYQFWLRGCFLLWERWSWWWWGIEMATFGEFGIVVCFGLPGFLTERG